MLPYESETVQMVCRWCENCTNGDVTKGDARGRNMTLKPMREN
jgi:hypothetical protein